MHHDEPCTVELGDRCGAFEGLFARHREVDARDDRGELWSRHWGCLPIMTENRAAPERSSLTGGAVFHVQTCGSCASWIAFVLSFALSASRIASCESLSVSLTTRLPTALSRSKYT